MAQILKLYQHGDELVLSSGRYLLDDTFTPPTPQNRARYRVNLHFQGANTTTSRQEVNQAISDISEFLRRRNDNAYPLYLMYKPSDTITAEPILGTIGRYHRWKVRAGSVQISNLYGLRDAANTVVPGCSIELELDAPEGYPQMLAKATGGVYPDFIGTERTHFRGVQVCPVSGTGGNLFTNPVFGNATYDTGWTASDVTATQNRDNEYILFGNSSARLVGGAESSGQGFYQTLTLTLSSVYMLSFYVKATDSADFPFSAGANYPCMALYGTSNTAFTFKEMGNGWWLAYAAITGTGVAAAVGIHVRYPYTIYLGAAQCELNGDVSPFFYGDMPGCAWSSTRHASASTRTAGKMTLSGTAINPNEGTLVVAWRTPFGVTQSGTYYLLDTEDTTSALQLYYASGKFSARFGASGSVAEYTVTPAAGALNIIHMGYAGAKEDLYYNGVWRSAASNDLLSAPDTIYIGTDSSNANPCSGTFLYFGYYKEKLTDAQVTQSYNEIYGLLYNADPGLMQSPGLPYLWTKGTDDTIDQAEDSTRDHTALLAGIPGDLPAEVEYRMTTTRASTTAHNVFLGVSPIRYPYYAKTTDLKLYDEKSGTADAANASGGEYEAITVNSTSTWASAAAATSFTVPAMIYGPVHAFARLKAATGSKAILARLRLGASSTPQVSAPRISITPTTSYGLYYIGTLTMQQLEYLKDYEKSASAVVEFLKIADDETVHLDFLSFVIGSVAYQPGAASTAGTSKALRIKGMNAAIAASTTAAPLDNFLMQGAPANAIPGVYNLLDVWLAANAGVHVITETIKFDSIYVTPKYDIL